MMKVSVVGVSCCWDNYLYADIVWRCSCVKMKHLTKILFETQCFETPAWYLLCGKSVDARQECWKVGSRILCLSHFSWIDKTTNSSLIGHLLVLWTYIIVFMGWWKASAASYSCHQNGCLVRSLRNKRCFAAFIRSFNGIQRLWKNILLSGRF